MVTVYRVRTAACGVSPTTIGYIKFDAFRNPDVCAPTASAAIASLAHCSALIAFSAAEEFSYDLQTQKRASAFRLPMHCLWQRSWQLKGFKPNHSSRKTSV
jgi:hypothetical protein